MTQTSTSRSLWQGGALSSGGDKSSKKNSNAFRRPALTAFFVVMVIALTVLQKIVVPLSFGNLGGPIEVALPLTYLALFTLVFFVKIRVDLKRLALFAIFLAFAFISIVAQQTAYSANSVLLMLLIYAPFILYIEVGERTFRKLMGVYLDAMLIFGAIAMLQHIIQLIWTWHAWPNLETIVSPQFLFDGFVYIQPIKYRSPIMKPNAVFFLEVSYLSQWTAIALAIELVYFQRLWRMVCYAVVLLACFAGTGLLLLLLCGPVLLTRLSRRSLGIVAIVGAVCMITIVSINWLPQVQQRFIEVKQYNTSASNRFVVPFKILSNLAEHPSSVFVGEGPGSGDKSKNEFWWVSTKLAYEYGFLTAVSFTVFFGYVLFGSAPSQRIAFLFMIFFNFMGGFIIPVYPFLVFLLGGLFRFRKPKPS